LIDRPDAEWVRGMLRSSGLPADETTIEALRGEVELLRRGLGLLREITLGDVATADAFQLDPDDWR